MKTTLLLLPILFILACRGDKTKLFAENTPKRPTVDYTIFKDSVTLKKAVLKNKPHSEAAAYLYQLVNDDIYAYWQGTP